jgi:hypothetical protein
LRKKKQDRKNGITFTWYQSRRTAKQKLYQIFLQVQKIEDIKKMDYSPEILLTSHNYLEWKSKILLHLRCKGLYQITMAMEVEPDSVDEKNDFFNRQDMAIGSIGMSVSPEVFHQVYEESQGSTPNELWTRLEVLFGNKEYCKDFMQEVKQIELEEKPSEDQASYYEESSTKVFAEICIPLIEGDVYSISDLFSEIHVEDIWHASQESHADTFACISGVTCRHFCMHLKSKKKSHAHQTPF